MHDEFVTIGIGALGIVAVAFGVRAAIRRINSRKKPPRKFWIRSAWIGGVLVVYVLSFGPAYWWQYSSEDRIIPIIYAPLIEATGHMPRYVWRTLSWYASCGITGASMGMSDEGKRLGCSPLWRNGLRAWHWFTPDDLRVSPPNPKGS